MSDYSVEYVVQPSPELLAKSIEKKLAGVPQDRIVSITYATAGPYSGHVQYSAMIVRRDQ